MKQQFEGWSAVAVKLRAMAASATNLNEGQWASLNAIADRIPSHGVLIADEVGLGKTRIAVALAHAVMACGGRVAVLIPPGLGFQWQTEFREFGRDVPEVLRSLDMFNQRWREPVQKPWFDEDAVLISHFFCNWTLKPATRRFALLPELHARWRMQYTKRPPGYSETDAAACRWGGRAAPGIVEALWNSTAHPARAWLQGISEKYTYRSLLNAGDYQKDGPLRSDLERAVGVGLGVFDLVLIDEAHKSRDERSVLSRLLEGVVQPSSDARRVAITATPVELSEDQWTQTLQRIGVERPFAEAQHYAEAVRRLRGAWRANPAARLAFVASARAFEAALSPYVLRRDKRRDKTIMRFAAATGRSPESYRELDQHIRVIPEELSLPWRRAVCAAEALSVMKPGSISGLGKRLRLTFGNGHGIAGLIDQFKQDDMADQAQLEVDGLPASAAEEGNQSAADKRSARARWWSRVIVNALGKDDEVLYAHPAIQAAAKQIESLVTKGEKVLVFGRFTKPMGALVKFLNACEMLRRLARKQPWPHAKIHEGNGKDDRGEWPAVHAAYRWIYQREMQEQDRQQIVAQLHAQYEQLEADRKRFRSRLLGRLESALQDKSAVTLSLFRAFRARATDEAEYGDMAAVSRALLALRPEFLTGDVPSHELAEAFIEVLRGAMDRDDPESTDGDAEENASGRWQEIAKRLSDEFLRPEGGFARLMDGSTRPHSRQMLQQAFNRHGSFPQVLVAQSLVGREGLNLHRECRAVILLHPEWNPGVVEQQIGRVDRVGSRWSRSLEEALKEGRGPEDLPRILVKSVIFEGTYDEMHWEVLQERWNDLRAQLHGVPIPEGAAQGDAEGQRIVHELNAAAPDFYPRQR
jgi:superfamily II DNA or RNA helicase